MQTFGLVRLHEGGGSCITSYSTALFFASWAAFITTPVPYSLLAQALAGLSLYLSSCVRLGDVLSPPSYLRAQCWAIGVLLGVSALARRATGSRDALSWLETLMPLLIHSILATARQGQSTDREARHGGYHLLLAAIASAVILPSPLISVNQAALGACYVLALSLALWMLEDVLGGCPPQDSFAILDEKPTHRVPSEELRTIVRDVTWTLSLVCLLGTWLFESPISIISFSWKESSVLACAVLSTVAKISFLLSLVHVAGAEYASMVSSAQSMCAAISTLKSTRTVIFGTFSVVCTISSPQYLLSECGVAKSKANRFRTILTIVAALCLFCLGMQSFFDHRLKALQTFSSAVNIILLPANETWQPMQLTDNTIHPIEYLTRTAQQEYKETLARQSNSLKVAVSNYKTRYKLPPPPLFDKWYEFAKQRDVDMIDEFETIHSSMLPFWALKPQVLRARVTEALGYEDNGLIALIIRHGRVQRVEGGEIWQQESLKGLVKNFVHFLPDLDIAFNRHDEPRIIVPHDELSRMVLQATEQVLPVTFSQPLHRNEFSSRPEDMDAGHRTAEVMTSRFNDYAHQNTWIPSRLSCSPYSAARDFNNADEGTQMADNRTAYALGELGFIYNLTASTDVCSSPSFKSTHGFFNRPNAFKVAHELIPIFSESKVSSFQDIVFPSMWHWNRQLPVERTETLHQDGQHINMYDANDNPLAWEEKQNTLWWRGSTTGGYSKNGAWRHHHRQRLVRAMNALDRTKILEPEWDETASTDTKERNVVSWVPASVSRYDLRHLFNVSFSGVGQCSPADCHAQEEFFAISPHVDMSQTWSHRHLLDMDGNAFSARFYALLQSGGLVHKMQVFREWHDEWIKPWVHYVPLSLSGHEWAESMHFLSQEDSNDGTRRAVGQVTNKSIAKGIADSGKAWVETGGGRREAMEVWMFRLLLEYARVVDDSRLEIGYDG